MIALNTPVDDCDGRLSPLGLAEAAPRRLRLHLLPRPLLTVERIAVGYCTRVNRDTSRIAHGFGTPDQRPKHDQAYCGNSARTLALSPSPSSQIEGIFLSARKVAIPTALPASISVGKCTPATMRFSDTL